MADRAPPQDAGARRRALVEELRAVERAWSRVRAGLVELGPGERLPGLYLVAGIGAGRVLLPCARVAEVARLVACDPIPGAPGWILGGFVWRGVPGLAADLGARLGSEAAGSLDAIMVILDGTPPVALVVDEVSGLVEDPLLADGASASGDARLLVGACRVEAETVPVVMTEALEREVQEAA